MNVVDLPVDQIFADDQFNCRGNIAPLDVVELMRSIEQNGLQQAIVVQPFTKGDFRYRIVMGHCRHRCFQLLKRTTIPCIIRTDLSDLQAMTLNLVENLHRTNLSIMQEARAINKYFVAGCTQDDVARMINKSRGWVQIRYTALRLDPAIQVEIEAGFLSQEQIKQVYALPSKDLQFEAVRDIKDSKIRGDRKKIDLKPKKQYQPDVKRVMALNEIFDLQNEIYDKIGNNFGTRCLACAAGEITRSELMKDVAAIMAGG